MTNHRVYILGGAQSDFERNWHKEGKNFVAMISEVVTDAIEDIGLTFNEIAQMNDDRAVAGYMANFAAEFYLQQGHLNAFMNEVDDAFIGMPMIRYESACASGSAAIYAALHQIGRTADLGIVVGLEMMKTLDSIQGAQALGAAAYYEQESRGRKFPFPELFGKLAIDTVRKYGLDENRYMDNLAIIAAKNYSNAKRNPNAQTRKWFMNESHARARGSSYNDIIGVGLAVSDCSQITDGAACLFLCSEAYAEKYCMDRGMQISELPYIAGSGSRMAPITYSEKISRSRDCENILPWTQCAIMDAYHMAGVTVADIDVIETHDCFTSSEYAAISCFGIIEPGREYEVIEDGRLHFGGKLPMNPSGGLIGCGHPVGATGVRMMLDLAKQLMYRAGDYQVNGADVGAMLNIGGTATSNFAFVVKRG